MAAAQNKKSDNDTPVTIPWQAVGAWVTSTGITASEWLHLTDSLTFTPTITAVSMAASAAAGVMAGSSARTAAQRRALLNDLAEHMFPLQGFKKSSPKTIKVRSWLPVAEQTSDCHYRSYPAELRISYTSNVATRQLAAAARLAPSAFGGAGDDDIDLGAKGDWFKQVARLLTDCIGIRYTVTADRTNRTLIAKPAAPEPPVPPSIARLKRFVARQFESDAKLLDYKLDSTGQVIKFAVSHTISDKLARMPARQNSIDNIMSAVLPGRWRGQWNHIKDIVTFEQRPTLPRLLWPRIYAEPQSLDEVKALYPKQRFYIGEDEDRNPIWCCPKEIPQRLITGPTGSGKTSTIHTWITQAARAHWPVYIVDRKRIEYRGFRDWPNVQMVATRIEEQIALIYHVWSLMQIRYDAVEAGIANAEDYVPILLILDEYTELLRDMESWYSDLKQKFDTKETKNWPRFLDMDAKVQSIARLGRTGRVHLIKGMQRPDVKYLDGEARDNFTGRQSLGQLGPQGAKMMWGNQQTGTAIPPGLLGRGIAKNEHGKPVEVQHYFTPDPSKNEHMSIPHAQDVLDALRPTYTSHPRIVFDTPYEPGEDIAAAHYMEYQEAPVYHAVDRPDLDPLSDEYRYKPTLTPEARERATGALGPAHNKSRAHRGTGTSAAQPTSSPRKRSRKAEAVTEDWPGYGDTVPRAHEELQVGDLILVNPGNDEWGVLELESEPDPIDEHLMVLQYRGLDGEHDLLVIDPGDPVISRRLVEEDEDLGHSDQEAA